MKPADNNVDLIMILPLDKKGKNGLSALLIFV